MRSSSYRFTRIANLDIDAIWKSIAKDNPDAADRVVADIYDQVKLLAGFPEAGHYRQDLAERRPLRFLPVRNYFVIYLADREPLIVVRVLHAARNLSAILRKHKLNL